MHRWLLFLFLIVLSASVSAEATYSFKEKSSSFVIEQYQQLRINTLKVSSVSAVLATPASAWEDKQSQKYLPFDTGHNWIKFDVVNHLNQASMAFIDIANRNTLEEVKVFYVNQKQNTKQITVTLLNSDLWTTSLSIAPHEQVTIYLRLDTQAPTNIQISLKKESAFVESIFDAQFTQGFAVGGMLCLSLAALLLFFGTGNRPLLWLFAFFITRTVLLSTTMGSNLYYLFPEYPSLKGIEYPTLSSISVVFYYLFIANMFKLSRNLPAGYKIIKGACVIIVVYAPLSLLFDNSINTTVGAIMHFFVTSSIVVIGWQLHKRKMRLSLAITIISFIQLFVGILYFASYQYYWFDQAHTLMFVGFWLHSILVIFLLSKQYRHQMQDKQIVQKQALAQANTTKKAQDELLALQNITQEELEVRVQERTFELNIALQELEEANRELEEKNTSDELTSLYNRRFYDQKVLAEFRRSKRNLTPLSLLLIDIDYFKHVNDEHGHLAGDKCLIAVAAQIKLTTQRSTDIACRYGGEEFIIILPETDEEGAMGIADKLRKQVEELTVTIEQQDISLTISCGISTYRQESFATMETIFNCADKALYRAKNEGRNQVQFLPLDLDK